MTPHWKLAMFVLIGSVPIASVPIAAQAQYPMAHNPYAGLEHCTPGYRVTNPWGELLEPGVVACSPAFDCGDAVMQSIVPHVGPVPQYSTTQVSPEMLDLSERVRNLEVRVNNLDGQGPKPIAP